MKRRTLFFLGLSGPGGLQQPTRAAPERVQLVDYIAPDTLPRFEAETGIRVRYAIYESNEEMLARALSGNSGWDLVFPSNYYVRPMRELGLLAPLDRTILPNLAELDDAFQRPSWDPDHAWSVPYMWGSCGILYNGRLAPAPQRSADMWDERLRGRMTMLDDPAEVLGASLKMLGRSWNATDPDDLQHAAAEARRQKPLLRAYLDAEVRDQAVAGDVLACQIWANGRATGHGRRAAPAVLLSGRRVIRCIATRRLCCGRAGGRTWRIASSTSCCSRRSPLRCRGLPDGYHQRPRPETAARVRCRAADAVPPPDVLARGEWFEALPAGAPRLRDRLWTEIKSS